MLISLFRAEYQDLTRVRRVAFLAVALGLLVGCHSPSLLAREVSASKNEWNVTILSLDTEPNEWSADYPEVEFDGSSEVGRKLIWIRCSIENTSAFKRVIPLGFSSLELENRYTEPHFIRAPRPFFRSFGIAGLYMRNPEGVSFNAVLDCFDVEAGSSKDFTIAYRVESRRSVPKALRIICSNARSWDDWLEIKKRDNEDNELLIELPLAGFD